MKAKKVVIVKEIEVRDCFVVPTGLPRNDNLKELLRVKCYVEEVSCKERKQSFFFLPSFFAIFVSSSYPCGIVVNHLFLSAFNFKVPERSEWDQLSATK
jgi:hypothetical protein